MGTDLTTQVKDFKTQFNAVIEQLEIPDKKTIARLKSVAVTAVTRDPKLLEADRASLMTSLRMCSNHGLVPDGNEATLQIYSTKVKDDAGKDVWIKKVQYQPMVRGIINRVLNSGKVTAFWAEIVYEGETFSIDISHGDRRPVHSPDYFGRNPDLPVVGAYAVAKLSNGSVDCEPMPMSEIKKVRAVAKTQKVWDGWFEEKAKVAVMRRMSKRLPLSSDDMDFIMNRDEHDMDRDTSRDITPKARQTFSQRLVQANATDDIDHDAEPTAEPIDDQDIVDVEPIEPSKQYLEGANCRKEDIALADCPYEVGTDECADWLNGWNSQNKAMG